MRPPSRYVYVHHSYYLCLHCCVSLFTVLKLCTWLPFCKFPSSCQPTTFQLAFILPGGRFALWYLSLWTKKNMPLKKLFCLEEHSKQVYETTHKLWMYGVLKVYLSSHLIIQKDFCLNCWEAQSNTENAVHLSTYLIFTVFGVLSFFQLWLCLCPSCFGGAFFSIYSKRCSLQLQRVIVGSTAAASVAEQAQVRGISESGGSWHLAFHIMCSLPLWPGIQSKFCTVISNPETIRTNGVFFIQIRWDDCKLEGFKHNEVIAR